MELASLFDSISKGNRISQKDCKDLEPSKMSQLLYCAIYYNNGKSLKMLLHQGVELPFVKRIDKIDGHYDFSNQFEESPFIVYASRLGRTTMVNELVQSGMKLTEEGYIGYSLRHHNKIISNCLAAAVYNGCRELLLWIMGSASPEEIKSMCRHKAKEVCSQFKHKKDCTNYTALMLAVVGKYDSEIVKALVNSGANVKDCDNFNNTILHLCVMANNEQALRYFIDEIKIAPDVYNAAV
jgi:hypothetical protein